MRMRERSTAHAQTKKGLKNQRLVISREFPDFFLISRDFSRISLFLLGYARS